MSRKSTLRMSLYVAVTRVKTRRWQAAAMDLSRCHGTTNGAGLRVYSDADRSRRRDHASRWDGPPDWSFGGMVAVSSKPSNQLWFEIVSPERYSVTGNQGASE